MVPRTTSLLKKVRSLSFAGCFIVLLAKASESVAESQRERKLLAALARRRALLGYKVGRLASNSCEEHRPHFPKAKTGFKHMRYVNAETFSKEKKKQESFESAQVYKARTKKNKEKKGTNIRASNRRSSYRPLRTKIYLCLY